MPKTGDIALFKGEGLFSALIMAAPSATHSHVALVYEHEVYGLCLFESTSMGTIPDLLTDELLCGVQLVPFQERVDSYDGGVELRYLNKPLTKYHKFLFRSTIAKYHGIQYEKDKLQLYRAQADKFPWNKNEPDESSIFCSEIETITLRASLVLSVEGEPANEFTPSNYNQELDWINGYKYTEAKKL